MPKLENRRHERFAQEYTVSGNATKAYINAGFSNKGATVSASKLLAKANIKGRVDELMSKTVKKLEITRERIMAEYAKIAFLDPKKLYDESGSLKNIHDMDDDSAAAITSLEVLTIEDGGGKVSKIKVSDKRAALDSLAKTFSMFTEKHEHTGKDGDKLLDENQIAMRIAFALSKAQNQGKE